MVVGSTTKLLLCLLVVYCCTVVTEGQQLIDCCTKVKDKRIPKKWVKDYRQQVSGQGCDIDATIFVPRKKKQQLCAPAPSEDNKWVEELMKHVDNLKEHCRNNNYKGNRCRDLKPK